MRSARGCPAHVHSDHVIGKQFKGFGEINIFAQLYCYMVIWLYGYIVILYIVIICVRHAARVPPPYFVSQRFVAAAGVWRMQVVGGGCDASASFLKGRVPVFQYFYFCYLEFIGNVSQRLLQLRALLEGTQGTSYSR